jgi:hypothetical protein
MQVNQLQSSAPKILISKSGVASPYTISVADYTDLARAVEREGPPKLAVAWTLLQRFGLLYPLYPNLSVFVKAYAQPINPQWFSNGPAHLAALAKLDSYGKAKENTAASQREGWAKTPLESISKDTLAVLDAVFAGTKSPVPLASHYAAPITRANVDAAKKARADFASKRGYGVVDYGNILTDNWFYSEAPMSGVKVSASSVNPNITSAFLALGLLSVGSLAIVHMIGKMRP